MLVLNTFSCTSSYLRYTMLRTLRQKCDIIHVSSKMSGQTTVMGPVETRTPSNYLSAPVLSSTSYKAMWSEEVELWVDAVIDLGKGGDG